MSYFRELFKQSSYYFISNVLAMFAGFISFPIWTRVFSKSEYGIFSLVSITISLGVGISKFGLQHSALRYHSDFKEKIIDLDMSYYYTTLFVSSFLISAVFILFFLLIGKLWLNSYINQTLIYLLPLIALLIFLSGINSLLTMFIRADNRGGLYSIFTIAERYGFLLFAIIIVFFFMKNLYGLFLGYLVSEVLIFLALLSIFIKKMKITRISLTFLKEALKYGFPLIWMELSNMILNFGDRYLIQLYMGSEAVGVYSVAYNLSGMAESFLTSPLRLAIIPLYIHIWNKNGEKETKMFLNNTLNYYFMLGLPIAIGLSWFGKEIIILLATSKFQESATVIPYIIFSQILYGSNIIFAAGLRIYKRTTILMYLSLVSCLVNIFLNVILIPKFGILGAAYATLIAYMFLTSLIIKSSYNYLKIKLDINKILKYAFISILTMFLLSLFMVGSIKGLMMKIIVGVLVYFLFIFLLDKEIRDKAFLMLKS